MYSLRDFARLQSDARGGGVPRGGVFGGDASPEMAGVSQYVRRRAEAT
jgi:hypothetical protein